MEKNPTNDSLLVVNDTSIIGDGSFSTDGNESLDIECNDTDDTSNENSDPEKIVFSQITSQLAKMSTFVEMCDLSQEKMDFKINSEMKSLQIIHTNPNGSCLFQSLAHQLSDKALNSRQQKLAAKALRKKVVAHIKANLDSFTLQLNNTVYDSFSEGDAKNSMN